MTKLIVVENPSEELIDDIITFVPCISNGTDLLIPYDCLEDIQVYGMTYKIIEY